jgi:hypothetical protein
VRNVVDSRLMAMQTDEAWAVMPDVFFHMGDPASQKGLCDSLYGLDGGWGAVVCVFVPVRAVVWGGCAVCAALRRPSAY